MSVEPILSGWARGVRVRSAANDALIVAPLVLAAAAVGWRWQGAGPAVVLAILVVACAAAPAIARARRFDRRWLVRRLDGGRADMEDSAELLFAEADALGVLQRLQRARLERRIAEVSGPDVRPGWSTRTILLLWSLAVLLVAALLLVPARRGADMALAPTDEGVVARPGVPQLVGQRLRVVAPGYTGIGVRELATLDARVPEGSVLTWTLRYAPQPGAAALAFVGAAAVPLTRDGDVWTARRGLDRSILYRIAPGGGRLHRIDVVPDTPPEIRVLSPETGLTIAGAGQRGWPLAFEVRDDHGVAATAQLRIVLAQGEGENISFKERSIRVGGSGGGRVRRFVPRLDLGALGFGPATDLVVQLIVADNRAPRPQIVRGPSLILRWPPGAASQGSCVEGAVKKTLPAYFRSQRQIIIDAEALLKQRRTLAPDIFLKRSDAIGVDQRILRMRYGQFLGEEAEGGPKGLPTNDDTAPAAGADAHDGAAPPAAAVFGKDDNVVAEYGHVHDEAEAATLLDPGTRATLKKALDQMWQSELALRQGDPARALPPAYKALGFIKEVQQATRIFLARVGPELPPIDPARRMTGKRDGIVAGPLALVPREGIDAVPAAVWRGLEDRAVRDPGLGPLERWVAANRSRVPDPLAFAAAIDAVRRDPGCGACRRGLRGLVWSVLARPPANVVRRSADDEGRRYLDAVVGR